mmetsp:Transcript_26979/g.61143  ORF Transcript_26979/g.61143 Transcript_26979/m.61143 type:complete len:237 (+) Transcript_26979:343-1053(+)
MDDIRPVDVSQCNQQLLRVRLHRLQGHALILRVLLQSNPQVVPHALEHEAQVPAVAEGPNQADHVALLGAVGLGQPLQDVDLLLRRLSHHVVASHDLDSHLYIVLLVGALHDVREDALPALVLGHEVAPAHDLPDLRLVVPFLVVPVVRGRTCGGDRRRLLERVALLQRALVDVLVEHFVFVVVLRLLLKHEPLNLLHLLQRLLVGLLPLLRGPRRGSLAVGIVRRLGVHAGVRGL